MGYLGCFFHNLVVIPDWSWEEVSVASTYSSAILDLPFVQMMFLRFIHVVACVSLSLHVINPFISYWRYGLFSFFWLLWIMLLWTFVCKFSCEYMFSFLLGKYLTMKLLGHVVTPCLSFWGTITLFSERLPLFIFPSAMYENSSLSTSSPTLVFIFFWF